MKETKDTLLRRISILESDKRCLLEKLSKMENDEKRRRDLAITKLIESATSHSESLTRLLMAAERQF